MNDLLRLNGLELLSRIFSLDQKAIIRLLIEHTFFIKAENAMKVVYPNYARESKDFHPKVYRGGESQFEGQKVKITFNKKARDAFGALTKLKLNGSSRNIAKGWEVAHIWGHVYDPNCFTAGWNLCLLPNFLRDLTEQQNSHEFYQSLIKQISYDLYFRGKNIPQKLEFIKDQNIILSNYIDLSKINTI